MLAFGCALYPVPEMTVHDQLWVSLKHHLPEKLVCMLLSTTSHAERLVPIVAHFRLPKGLRAYSPFNLKHARMAYTAQKHVVHSGYLQPKYMPHIESRYVSHEHLRDTRHTHAWGSTCEERNPAFILHSLEHTLPAMPIYSNKSYGAQLPKPRPNFIMSSSGVSSKEMGIEHYNQS
jgi:hypothetical protein